MPVSADLRHLRLLRIISTLDYLDKELNAKDYFNKPTSS